MRSFPVLLLAAALAHTLCAKDPETARKLLYGAVEMASGVQPETGVVALMRAGIAYAALDKKAALVLLSRASSAASVLTNEEVREEYAATIVRAAADIDVHAATEMLRAMPKPAAAATAVVRRLVSTKRFDDAVELLALAPEQAEYPFEAASYLIAYLPQDDPRRAIAFARATAAYSRVPSGPYPAFVERYGKQMPAELRTKAVSLLLQRIGAWKDPANALVGESQDADIEFHSPQQTELRELTAVARMFDSAAVDDLISRRPDIAAALASFRKPRKPAEAISTEPAKPATEDDDPFSPPFGIGMADNLAGFQQRINEYSKATTQAEPIAQVMKKDPAEAVRLARALPEVIRAETLAIIASTALANDTATATNAVEACESEIRRVSNPASRVAALIKLGGIYTKLNDPARAFAAYERALADGIALWSRDSTAEHRNIASVDTWPSTQAVRTAAYEAALNLGARAEGLLAGMTVSDLAVLARIQMARALLGLDLDVHNINVRWVESDRR